ncbi:hypothetical protein BKA64DRAFT_340088 [Cadophora sp. MPI-SDFR-AT-0126]|nr:hypothetical protein BKA64DRAFT_340088 [Leotiomycetes sp. MPI-SDFR-AT-0126]
MRAKGLGIFNIACWSFSVVTQYVYPIGPDNINWKFYIVYLALDIVFLVNIYFTFPETQNRSLEDVDVSLEDSSKSGSARNSMIIIDGVEKAGDGNIFRELSKI